MLGGVMACGAFAQSASAAPDATFRADVAEVRVSFSATDQNDRVLATILPSDFAIVDQDRVVRDFRSFARSEYTGLDVAVLLDSSESITPRFRQELTNVLAIIGQTGGVPDESFSVVSFRNLEPVVLCEGNCRALDAQGQFPAITSGGLTPLYDSISFASRRLGQAADRAADLHIRKILIVFSDGVDTASIQSFPDAVNAALENDVAIYSVDIGGKPHAPRGTLVLRSFSFNTGGRYFMVEEGTAKIIDAILEDFHATYTVAYKLPSHAVGFHQVRILPTHNLSLQFHCRRGYYYPSNSGY